MANENRTRRLWDGLLWGLLLLVMGSLGPTASPVWSESQPARSDEPPKVLQAQAGQGPVVQGPAVETPREVLAMLDQRKRVLEKKEEALRAQEARLATLKSEIEQILTRHEQAVKAAEKARRSTDQTESEARKAGLAQLAKMYETMSPEEAAARIEKMPDQTALQLLRALKGKTAGSILAQVKPAKAAKLTQQLIAKP
ncbi:MAG: hypothetical protein AB1411_01980 [Nitrospirota bacterium]